MTDSEEIDGWDFVVGAFDTLDVATLADAAVDQETLALVFVMPEVSPETVSTAVPSITGRCDDLFTRVNVDRIEARL